MANAIHPMYGSVKLGNKMSEAHSVSGKDGGKFTFGRLPTVSVTTGADNIVSTHVYDDGLKLYFSSQGANTIGNQPLQTANGMDYKYDSANNEGIQWSLANNLNKEHIDAGPQIERYRIGSDAFYASLIFKAGDVSAADDVHFGFRLLQAPTAIDTYTDVASIGWITAANPAAIAIATALNNASMTETACGETVADDTYVKLAVYVSSAGVVTYKIDDAAPTTTAAFTFDSGDYVTPFFSFLAAGDAGVLTLREFEHGRQ